jgi:hypothetical protein
MYFPHVDYSQLLVLVLSMGFFVKGARMDLRSPLLWGALSFGSWCIFTQLLVPGVVGALLSQLAVLAGLTVQETLRERRETKRRSGRRAERARG